jgi:hypothetical protein
MTCYQLLYMQIENKENIMANKSWTLLTEEDPNDPDSLLLTFPPDLLESAGWKAGDILDWKENEDGSWSLTKKE